MNTAVQMRVLRQTDRVSRLDRIMIVDIRGMLNQRKFCSEMAAEMEAKVGAAAAE